MDKSHFVHVKITQNALTASDHGDAGNAPPKSSTKFTNKNVQKIPAVL